MAPAKKSRGTKSTEPGYLALIKDAIGSLKERSGSSRQAIDKVVSAKKGSSYSKSRLNIALKKGVESGALVQVKGSFKLAASSKKAAAPKAKTVKKATTKKATTKKSPSKKTATKKATTKKVTSTKKKATKKTPTKKTATKKRCNRKYSNITIII